MEMQFDKEQIVCSTHNAQLSCLETVLNGIHVDLVSVDNEVNNLVIQGYEAIESCLTPHFFTNPKRDTKNFAKLLEILAHGHDEEHACSSCLKFSSCIVFLQREVDCYVQFTDFIIDKFSAVSKTSLGSTITPISKSLKSSASIRRSMIRTNPNVPVFSNQSESADKKPESLKVNNSSESIAEGETDYFHSEIFFAENKQFENCSCCLKCRSIVAKFRKTFDGKLKYIQLQCSELQTKMEAKLQEKNNELQNQLEKVQRSRQIVMEKLNNLKDNGKQCYDLINGVEGLKNGNSHQSLDSKSSSVDFQHVPYENSNKHSDDSDYGSGSCVQVTSRLPSASDDDRSHEQTATNQRLPSASSSEGSYTLPIVSELSNLSLSQGGSHGNESDKSDLDTPVFVSQTDLLDNCVDQSINANVKLNCTLPSHVDFQLKRSSSVLQINSTFNRDTFRRRSHTVSNPLRKYGNQPMNDSGPYSSIGETTDNIVVNDNSKAKNSVSKCSEAITNNKEGKIKKSKSSILLRANRLKNYLTKKFKRKSWGGATQGRQISPTSIQASSTGVQFFEYDFSDDGRDKSLNMTSDRLGDLSGMLDMSTFMDSFSDPKENSHVLNSSAYSKYQSNGGHDSWIFKRIAEIEKHLKESGKPRSASKDPKHGCVLKGEYAYPHTEKRSKKMVLPSRPVAVTDRYFGDMFLVRSPMESLSEISDIEPVNQYDYSSTEVLDVTGIHKMDKQYLDSEDKSLLLNNSKDTLKNSSRRRLLFSGDGASMSTNSSHRNCRNHSNSSEGYSENTSYSSVSDRSTLHSLVKQNGVPFSREEADGQESFSNVLRSSTVVFHELYLNKLWHLKPYLLLGTLSSSYLMYLVDNYPHNIKELPGYCNKTKEISTVLVAHVAKQAGNPQIFARNLVWHLFTLLELYGGKTASGQNTDSLDIDMILAVRNATTQQYHITGETWLLKCVPFIHQSINVLFNQKLRLPVFRALFHHSDC